MTPVCGSPLPSPSAVPPALPVDQRVGCNLAGRLGAVLYAAERGDDEQARRELLALLRFFPRETPEERAAPIPVSDQVKFKIRAIIPARMRRASRTAKGRRKR